MYYTLKDMVRLTGLNERTVPKMLERYTQRTGIVRVGTAKDGRHWRYSEDDLAAVLAEKAHAEEERTRKVPADYTHDTDTDILARLEAIEAQLAALRERAPYLFAPNAPVARSEGRQTVSEVLDEYPAVKPSVSHYGAFHVARNRSTLPEGLVPVDRFAQAHGMRESQRSTWLEAARSGRLPAHIDEAGWRVVGAHGKVALVRYALDDEGRRVFCELWRNTEWFAPCEECPHE